MSRAPEVAVVVALLAIFVRLSTTRVRKQATPRLAATFDLLTLTGFGLFPPVLLACAAGTLGVFSSATRWKLDGDCFLASGKVGAVQLALYAGALALVARSGLYIFRSVVAARRAELRGVAFHSATARRLSNGATAWVVPSEQVAAYSGGLRHPRAVVTSGLLGLLTPLEQEAVLNHEVAHLQLGHPRLLVLGSAIANAYRWVPSADGIWRRLRRELEAAADDQAAAAVGSRALISALAKVALAPTQPDALNFADPEDLRYRIQRLQTWPSPNKSATTATALASLLLTAVLSWGFCEALNFHVPWWSILPCLVSLGLLGWRPTWRRSRYVLGISR